MHSSRMYTTHKLPYRRGFLPNRDPPGQRPPRQILPWTENPWTETLLDRDPLGQRPPGQRPSWTETPWTETLLVRDPPGHITCGACWDRDTPPINRIAQGCKNITLPLTSLGAVISLSKLQ